MFEDCGWAVSPVVRVHPTDRVSSAGALLGIAAALPPGPGAIRMLATIEVAELDDMERTELLEAWERSSRWVAAQQAKAVVGVAGEHESGRDDVARELVRAALRCVGGSPKACVETARDLAGPLRPVRDAMEFGDISYDHARVIACETETLDPETRTQVATAALARAEACTPAELRRKVRRMATNADPRLAEERARAAAMKRMVSRRVDADAQASMFLTGPAIDIQTIWSALDVLSARTTADDPRTLDQRRFDSLVGLAVGALAEAGDGGTTRSGLRPGVYLFADAATWAGLADAPVELDGYGPIPAGIAREHFATSTWRAVVTDALSGAVQSVSESRYVPSPRLRRRLHVADRRCRFPGCGAAVWFCDADHDLPYDQGGCTDADNCGLLCRRHHRLKTHHAWEWRRTPDRVTVWTDPTGRTYEQEPVRYLMPPRAAPPPEQAPTSTRSGDPGEDIPPF